MPKITIHLPDSEPMKFGFEDQIEVNVGRADDNDIIINHDSISGHHAQLKLQGDRYYLIDLESTNGTFLDGGLANNVPLHNGAVIVFGQVNADYECEEAEEALAGTDEFAGGGQGSGFESSIHAEIAEQSALPASFKNLSPIKKVEKKDVLSKVAMIACIIGIAAAGAIVAFATLMKVD